jgi:MFS family permease
MASSSTLACILYLPTILWLWRAPYGPKFRTHPTPTRALKGFADIVTTIRVAASNRTLWSMILLGGAASFFVGNAYQAQMPGFATDLGHGNPGLAYTSLLAADAAGALLGGFVLERFSLLKPEPRMAFLLATIWCCALVGFALAPYYPMALVLLATAGFVELSFSSMVQSLVQLNAPAEIRGRVIGLSSMAGSGLRMFSGITVGLIGTLLGIHVSLALSAGVLLVTITLLRSNLALPRAIDIAR